MWLTLGHESSIDVISRGVRLDRMSHSYLITGVENVGKTTIALDIARVANCRNVGFDGSPCSDCSQCHRIESGNHTDVFMYDLEPARNESGRFSTTVTVDQLREDFLKQVHRKPYEGAKRVFIIAALERMGMPQSNMLLKTLEEPPEDIIIILLSSREKGLLETIVSRCQLLNLKPVDDEVVREYVRQMVRDEESEEEEIVRLARGRIGWAHKAVNQAGFLNDVKLSFDTIEIAMTGSLEDKFAYSEELVKLFQKDRRLGGFALDYLLVWWRDVLLISSGREEEIINISRQEKLKKVSGGVNLHQAAEAIKFVRTAEENIERNVSPGIVCDDLMIRLYQLDDSLSAV